ncbi:hypothetical protein IWQ62_003488 [Dispira parvispora]|uniref:Uncharacterized protein n=1 Tax=Dispira parvispora TaxID=1520584 RepID=A0A9W8AMT4_9FUNG|nr:hypothetical protein IWQ62_003488 [Dispira parvispora]
MIRIRTSEGMELEVEREVMEHSLLIKGLLDDVGPSNALLPLPNVSGPILAKVVEYCRHYHRKHQHSFGAPTTTGSAISGTDAAGEGPLMPSVGHSPRFETPQAVQTPSQPVYISFAPPSSTRSVTTGTVTSAFTTIPEGASSPLPTMGQSEDINEQDSTEDSAHASAGMTQDKRVPLQLNLPTGQPVPKLELDDWDRDFCKMDQGTLFELILAANYLDIKPLLDLTCFMVANMIRGKEPEEIRRTFNIKSDFTPEEEEWVKRENEWCEDR